MKDNSANSIRKILIVGGGTSGWMSAAYLSHMLQDTVQITLVESPDIGRIGVGEATIPTLREQFMDHLGIPEREWMPECNATYKTAIKFANWNQSFRESNEYYYHCFGEVDIVDDIPLCHLWSAARDTFTDPMAYMCYKAPHICDRNLAPIRRDGRQAAHYAYHFDAILFANFLRNRFAGNGVTHIYDSIQSVRQHPENGDIVSVTGTSGASYDADLFIDCTGFAGVLIDKTLHEPILSFADMLFTDRALAINIPHKEGVSSIRPYTTATAMDAGWMWEIPLYTRSGNGYVFSSHFKSTEDAEAELREFFGERANGIETREIRYVSGRRRNSWVKNCVAIGLSSSFLEPIESTGIYFIYAALYQLVRNFPDRTMNPSVRAKYNERVGYMVEDVRDFIVLHYLCSPRTDTAFWRANMTDIRVPDSLSEVLALHKAGIPVKPTYHGNGSLYSIFEASFDRFWTNSNYFCILSGMNYLPETPPALLGHRPHVWDRARDAFDGIRAEIGELLGELPTQYDYLTELFRKRDIGAKSAMAGNVVK